MRDESAGERIARLTQMSDPVAEVDIHNVEVVTKMEEVVDWYFVHAAEVLIPGSGVVLAVDDGLRCVKLNGGEITLLSRENKREPWRWDKKATIGKEFKPRVDFDRVKMQGVEDALDELRERLGLGEVK